ncbi:hypothetical protein HYS31_00545 [Candidatus Woesearchaeota archaeon]|nr:hypothetical protein [Candidatus Woesearchaeota archaeon]
MKKSQLYGQVFIYILTLLIISFVLVYGYNAIRNFQDRAEQVSCLRFRNELKNAIELIQSDYGSVRKLALEVCAGYSKVCFVESKETPCILTSTPCVIQDLDPIIEDNIRDRTGKNTFFIDKAVEESYYIGSISVNPDVHCIKAVNGKISITLEGKGDYVELG